MSERGNDIIGKGETLLELLKMIESGGSSTPPLIYNLAIEKCEEITELLSLRLQENALPIEEVAENAPPIIEEVIENKTLQIEEIATEIAEDDIIILESQPTSEIKEIGCSDEEVDCSDEEIDCSDKGVANNEISATNSTPFLDTTQSNNDDIFTILANRESESLNCINSENKPKTTEVEPETTEVEPETTEVEPKLIEVEQQSTVVEQQPTAVEQQPTAVEQQDSNDIEQSIDIYNKLEEIYNTKEEGDKVAEESIKESEEQPATNNITEGCCNDVISVINQQSVTHPNIRKIISINDLFLFKRELFNGDNILMDSVFSKIDSIGSYSETINYLTSNFNWNIEEGSVASLLFIAIEERFKEQHNNA